MEYVRRLVIGLLVALTSCSGPSAPAPTTVPVTLPPLATTTTSAVIPVQLQGCASPPVTFSALCEIYELLQDWYVDQPVDPGHLTNMAITALDQDLSDLGTERRPRSLICAVPALEFERLCDRLAEVVSETGVAMGPLMDRVVAAMVEAAYGPFTYYLNPEQVTGFRGNGLVGGIGVLLDATDAVGSKCARLGPACPLRVVFVLEDNPGHEAGIQPGDVIVAVDGVPVEGQGFAATAARIAGDETGSVAITIEREDGQLELTIERAELVVPSVVWDVPLAGVGYLRIPDFEDDIPALVADALEELSGSYSTLVVDLRDNPGGYVFAAEAVASEFIPSGPIFHEKYGDVTETVESYGPGGLATSGGLVVLVNEGTASAAEILAGALRERRDAVIVGASTFGKDAIQIRFDLRNGGRADVVVARWTTPRGTTVANRGLVPDVELELTDDMTLPEIVQAAVEAAR
jgi:C-terminal peptidase prc